MSEVKFPGTESPGGITNGLPRGAVAFPLGVSLLVAAALTAAYRQEAWEYRIILAMNGLARRSAALDRAIHALTARDLLEGVVFIALIWYLWFGTTVSETRARLLTGTAAAATAGAISRLLQLVLPTHPRPLHTADLGFVLPFGVEPDVLNHYNPFPSDHGAVDFTLALVIWRMRPQLGLAALLWAAVVDIARVYDGYHYPSDVVGSIGLAILILGLFDRTWAVAPAKRAMRFEETHCGHFYMLAFVASYLVATLFDDVRQIGVGLAGVLLHQNPFLGG